MKKVFVVIGILIFSLFFYTAVYAEDLMAKAAEAENKGDYITALKTYESAFETISDAAVLEKLNKQIELLNVKILYSPIVDQDSVSHVVKSGESIIKIAKMYNTTPFLIKKSNNLKSDVLQVGQRLKVVKSEFTVYVDKSQNVLFLKKGDKIVKTYIVATGKDNGTPVGDFIIDTKLENPVHFRRDISSAVESGSDKNLLGTRWMGFNIPGYGIHGHAVEADLGKQVTLGCVRMLNKDVEELYDILPAKTKVTIVD